MIKCNFSRKIRTNMRPLNRGQISYCTRVLMQKVTHRAAKTILDKRDLNKDFENGISCSFVCVQHWESGTGRSGVSIMWLDGISLHVSEVWYINEAALLKWALSSLSHLDTVAIWLKDCHMLSLNKVKKNILGSFFFQVEICQMD